MIESEYSVSIGYSMAIIVLLTFFVVNLFVACVCFGYGKIKCDDVKEEPSEAAPAEQDSTQVQQEPVQSFRAKLAGALGGNRFETVLIIVIVLNMAVLASFTHDMGSTHQAIYNVCEAVFTGLFLLEAIVKMYAFGLRMYFTTKWNVFDFLVAMMSLLSVCIDSVEETSSLMAFRSLRMFRVLRLTRGVRSLQTIHATLKGLKKSLPALFSVGLLLVVVFVVYATIGYDLYGKRFNGDPRVNFDTLFNSLLCLVQLLSADSWESIM